MYIFIFIILILLLFVIFVIFNNNYIEKFDIFGAQPRDLGWGLGIPFSEEDSEEKICSPGFLCNTENSFGLYNKDCECISINQNNSAESESCNPGFLCMNDKGIGLYDNNCECIITNNKSNNVKKENSNLPNLEKDCYPRNTNFDAICKKINPKYGIKNIIPCKNNTAKVECALNYIDGSYYGESILRTPCHNIMTDFDTWCKYYNSSNVPPGYNVNSIGSKELLIGSKGGCYLNNGESDKTKASAICDYNHMDEIKKLSPAYSELNYNIFTDCKPIRKTNFKNDCATLLKINYNDAFANQIMGYDCNPGFARAKCIKGDDLKVFNYKLFQGSYDKNNQPEEIITDTVPNCNCSS